MEKEELLLQAQRKLRINDDLSIARNRLIIFVYTAPKCGSTSLVTSLRIAGASEHCTVLHLHNEIMLRVLYNIEGVTVKEIIEFNRQLGKKVVVIDIFRRPIEQKMSIFFENLAAFHFNVVKEDININTITNHHLTMEKVASRFNSIFEHLVFRDHFIEDCLVRDLYQSFDFENKYLLCEIDGIIYMKLRLQDSELEWSRILSDILNFEVIVVKDYVTEEREDDPIALLYKQFKDKYRLPRQLYKAFFVEDDSMKSVQSQRGRIHWRYYLSETEQIMYQQYWFSKLETTQPTPSHWFFTADEYKLYTYITSHNQHVNEIHYDHYKDEGCYCAACKSKRKSVQNYLKTQTQTKMTGCFVSLREQDRVLHHETTFLKKRFKKKTDFLQQSFFKTKTNTVKPTFVPKNPETFPYNRHRTAGARHTLSVVGNRELRNLEMSLHNASMGSL